MALGREEVNEGKAMRTLQTAHLTLEPQSAAHADEMFVVLSDPAIYEHENSPPPSAEWLRERFERLEARSSADGSQQWLNWVLRLHTQELIGYVQATAYPDHRAAIAYELGSRRWGRGLAHEAVTAMLAELAVHYEVSRFTAVLKHRNLRSLRLLERLGFVQAPPNAAAKAQLEPDELLMQRGAAPHTEP